MQPVPHLHQHHGGRSLDLIEIDGASNRGIDEIRDLRDKVNFAPSECRYKVYVIDEVHMLTNEAFNALLKTLEEPPSHVIFILCTTEPYRLPDTVLSRCQRFDFRKASVATLKDKLSTICRQEGIAVTPDALDYIARRATGSFRDAESLLDQLAAYGTSEVTLELVHQVLGAVPSALVTHLIGNLLVGNVGAGLQVINQAMDGGAEPRQFLGEILDHLRALLLLRAGGRDDASALSADELDELRRMVGQRPVSLALLVRAAKLFNEAANGLRTAVRPQLPLELAFVESTLPFEGDQDGALPPSQANESEVRIEVGQPRVASPQPAIRSADAVVGEEPVAAPVDTPNDTSDAASVPPDGEPIAEDVAPLTADEPVPEAELNLPVADRSMEAEPALESEAVTDSSAVAPTPQLDLDWVKGNWRQVLMRIRPASPQLQALLNSVEPLQANGDVITLACPSRFHREKLSENKNRDMVEQVLAQVLKVPCRVTYVIQAGQAPASEKSGSTPRRPADLFSANNAQGDERQELLNHPVVKELERRGGRISKVSLNEEEQEDRRG